MKRSNGMFTIERNNGHIRTNFYKTFAGCKNNFACQFLATSLYICKVEHSQIRSFRKILRQFRFARSRPKISQIIDEMSLTFMKSKIKKFTVSAINPYCK